MFIKKRGDKIILERIYRLKNNLELIRNKEGKSKIVEWINVLESFKDKSESEISSSITEDNSQKNRTLKWMVGLCE